MQNCEYRGNPYKDSTQKESVKVVRITCEVSRMPEKNEMGTGLWFSRNITRDPNTWKTVTLTSVEKNWASDAVPEESSSVADNSV